MDLELRPVTEDEFPAYARTVEGAFGHQPNDEEIADWRALTELDRSIGAFDGGEIVGTAGAFSFEVTVPGGATVPAAGVTAVGVRPTHRRRGILRRMMEHQLDDVVRRGEPIAVLTASETVIYGRFGYGLATSNLYWELRTEGTSLARPSTAEGRLRAVATDEAVKVMPGVYDRARLRHAGAVSRSAPYWENWAKDRERWREGASARFVVVHESPSGEPRGFAAYRRTRLHWEHGLPDGVVKVDDLYALDDEVEAALWEHLLAIDLTVKVQGGARPVDEPLRWRLADPRRLTTSDVVDHLWVRILDVPVALAARRYATDDRLVLEVDDAFRPASGGRYAVAGTPDGAACDRTNAAADLALSAADLGALYLGGVAASTLAAAGRIEERTPGALRRADPFFAAPRPPWCNTGF